MVQLLGIGVFTAMVQVQFLVRGTKIQQAVCCDQKKKKVNILYIIPGIIYDSSMKLGKTIKTI